MHNENQTPTSLLKTYHKALGYLDGDRQLTAEEALEVKRANSLYLPPLNLRTKTATGISHIEAKSHKRKAWSMNQYAMLLAAALAAVVFVPKLIQTKDSELSGIRTKGFIDQDVAVIYDRQGDLAKLESPKLLEAGDKFHIEISTQKPINVYVAAVDLNNQLLMNFEEVQNSKSSLAPGMSQKLSGGFELDAQNLHESLIVSMCEGELGEGALTKALNSSEEKLVIDGCHFRRIKLR